eukprot:6185236-Pleurochrysis_carterae.AAC.2
MSAEWITQPHWRAAANDEQMRDSLYLSNDKCNEGTSFVDGDGSGDGGGGEGKHGSGGIGDGSTAPCGYEPPRRDRTWREYSLARIQPFHRGSSFFPDFPCHRLT